MTVATKKYNPGFLTDDELVASFCVRTSEFQSIVEALRESTGASNVHQLVIGPRGSGKTSLLLRVAAEVRRDKALSPRLFPVVFAEESYGVGSLGEFWLECLRRLADQAPQRAGEPDLGRIFEDLRTIRDDQSLADRCLGAVQDFSDRAAKRLVLIVENLNMMFGDMPNADTAAWRLRQTLQTDPRIALLASATSRFDQIDHPDRALYDLFRTLQLRPLDTKECAVLWETVSGRPRAPSTIRSLEILTGGSPRLLSILARFGGGLSFQELMAQLLDLIDDHTEYFKSHLESLPAQERRVYLALAELWKPASTREIADQARLDTSKCSAQLKRLVERGAVVVAGGSARRKLHYLAERLYNIYYLLRQRRGSDPLLEALVRFMASYYSPEELMGVGVHMIEDLPSANTEMQRLYQIALKQIIALPELVEHCEDLWAKMPEDLAKALNQEQPLVSGASRNVHRKQANAFDTDKDDVLQMLSVIEDLYRQGQLEEALSACDAVVHRFGDSDKQPLIVAVAIAQCIKGLISTSLGRFGEALTAFEANIQHLEGCDAVYAQQLNVYAFGGKALSLLSLDRIEKALASYDEMMRRFANIDDEHSRDFMVLVLLFAARTLRKKGRLEEAMNKCDEILGRFGTDDGGQILELVGSALVEKARIELLLHRFDSSIRTASQAIEVYSAEISTQDRIDALTIRSLANLFRDTAICQEDIQTILEILLELKITPPSLVKMLLVASIKLGAAPVREWILASPAADLLLPLTTALDQDIGLQTHVAQEVNEVAQDIRRDLQKLREALIR